MLEEKLGTGFPSQLSEIKHPAATLIWDSELLKVWETKLHCLSHSVFTLVKAVLRNEFGEGNGNPLQYSCLESPMDGGAWWVAVHGVAKSRTRQRDFTFTFHFHALEKEMATHSSVLAWRIPRMGEPVGCCLWGRTESDTTEVT